MGGVRANAAQWRARVDKQHRPRVWRRRHRCMSMARRVRCPQALCGQGGDVAASMRRPMCEGPRNRVMVGEGRRDIGNRAVVIIENNARRARCGRRLPPTPGPGALALALVVGEWRWRSQGLGGGIELAAVGCAA